MVDTARPHSISVRQMRRVAKWFPKESGHPRPHTRADCELGIRPCPYVGCKYNLYLDVAKNGTLKLNFPGLEPGEMQVSCVLDIAEQGGVTLEVVGNCFNVTRERIRQIEAKVLLRLERQQPVLQELVGNDGIDQQYLEEVTDWSLF